MSADPKISVIVPTYNRAKELIKAVRSALAQTLLPFEVLVCDDGSNDDSKKLIAALNDSRVKWIDCGKNGGPAVPRNIGIKESKGKFVAFLDSDDEWLPSKLEKQLEAIVKNGTLVSCTNASRIKDGKREGAYFDGEDQLMGFADLLPSNRIICSSVLAHRESLITTSLFPSEKKFIAIEDYALWLRLSTKTNFAYLSECLVNYNDSSDTSIRANYTDIWLIFETVFSDFKKWCSKNKVKLDKEKKELLNEYLKKAKNKGLPTEWDNFKEKVDRKVKTIFKTNS